MSAFFLPFFSAFAPSIAVAQTAQQEVIRIFDLFRTFLSASQVLVTIAVALAFLFFFYNVAIYIRDRGRDGTKGAEAAKEKLLWSVIAIFVLTSIWGIIFFLFRVFIGPQDPTDTTVGNNPIWRFRLPLDPPTPHNVQIDDRGDGGIDDRGGSGIGDRGSNAAEDMNIVCDSGDSAWYSKDVV